MKHTLTLSLILFILCNSYNTMIGAESTPIYHTMLVVSAAKLEGNNQKLQKIDLKATSSVDMPNAILTQISKDTFAVSNPTPPLRPFHLTIDSAYLTLIKNPYLERIIIAVESHKLNHHFFIYPKIIFDSEDVRKSIFSAYLNKQKSKTIVRKRKLEFMQTILRKDFTDDGDKLSA